MNRQKSVCIDDFSINVQDNDSYYTNKLLQVFSGLGMKQYVCKPTRLYDTSSTLIDLLFSNYQINVQVIDSPQITDHAIIEFEITINECVTNTQKIMKRDLKSINRSLFGEKLKRECHNLNFEMSQVNHDKQLEMDAKQLISKIIEIINGEAPLKICNKKNNI